jgi:hypothetical protein
LTEAISYFVGRGKPFEHLALLSIASMNYGSGRLPFLKRRRSFLQWAPDLFDLSLIAQSEFTDVFLGRLQSQQIIPMTYTRIPSAAISSEQQQYIKLDLAVPRSFALMNQFATAVYYEHCKKPPVESFFAEPKLYRIRTWSGCAELLAGGGFLCSTHREQLRPFQICYADAASMGGIT